jgi:hypothetical protein
MAHIPSQIENIIDTGDQMTDDRRVLQICDMDADPILDVVNIEEISTLLLLHRIDQGDFDIANLDQAVGQITADETKTAGNEYRSATISI